MGYSIYTGITQRPKRQASAAQLEALAKGRIKAAEARAIRVQQTRLKEYEEAVKLQQKYKPDAPIIKQRVFEERIKDIEEINKDMGRQITRKKAIKIVTRSQAFMTNENLYKFNIIENISLSDRNILRKKLSDFYGTPYKQTPINWDEFAYSKAKKGLIHITPKSTIVLRIRKGADSTQPDWLEIKNEGYYI